MGLRRGFHWFVPADSNIDGKYALSAFFLGPGPAVLISAQVCGLADGHSPFPLSGTKTSGFTVS